MIQQNTVVGNRDGLNRAAAYAIVEEANRHSARIFLVVGDRKVNAKSLLGVLSLGLGHGYDVTVLVDGTAGQNEENALAAIVDVLQKEAQ